MLALILFKLWIFNIDFGTIISFLIGVVTGIIIIFLIYVLVVLSSIRTKDFVIKTEKDDLTTQEVKDMVLKAQEDYKDKSMRGELTRFQYCEQLSKDLASMIATRFYPNSKYPFFELSITEVTMLSNYISQRIDDLLDRRGIRFVKKVKVSTIIDFTNKKKQIEESKAFQTTVSVGGKISKVKYVLNFINPLNWGRKLVVDNVVNFITDRICIVIIGIVGEEIYKVYSKKVFDIDVNIDTGTEELIEQMQQSIKTAAKDMDEQEVASNNKNKLKSKIYRHEPKMSKSEESFSSKKPMKKKEE